MTGDTGPSNQTVTTTAKYFPGFPSSSVEWTALNLAVYTNSATGIPEQYMDFPALSSSLYTWVGNPYPNSLCTLEVSVLLVSASVFSIQVAGRNSSAKRDCLRLGMARRLTTIHHAGTKRSIWRGDLTRSLRG